MTDQERKIMSGLANFSDPPTAACQRCSECEGHSHHWLNNPDLGNDPADSDERTDVTHVCKHCPAVGNECELCGGTGEGDEEPGAWADGDCDYPECPECHGEGVVPASKEAHP